MLTPIDTQPRFLKINDLSSDAERILPGSGLSGNIINSWDHKALHAVSDFDTTHQFNANWVFELPFGRSKRFGRGANGLLDALIGGWQLSGIYRWTTGFPVGVSNGARWLANWQLGGGAIPVGPHPATGVHKNGDGTIRRSQYGDSGFPPRIPGRVGSAGSALIVFALDP